MAYINDPRNKALLAAECYQNFRKELSELNAPSARFDLDNLTKRQTKILETESEILKCAFTISNSGAGFISPTLETEVAKSVQLSKTLTALYQEECPSENAVVIAQEIAKKTFEVCTNAFSTYHNPGTGMGR